MTLVLALGCSSRGIPAASIESSQAKYDRAQSMFALKDYSNAVVLLNDVIAEGVLSPDFALSSLVMRANCHLELGDLPAALADIETAASGADDPSVIHGLRYRYWMKSGDQSKAQAELRLAQLANPQFRLP